MRMGAAGRQRQAFQTQSTKSRLDRNHFDTQDSRVTAFLCGVASPAGGAVQLPSIPDPDQSEPGIQRLHDPTASHPRRCRDAGNLDGRWRRPLTAEVSTEQPAAVEEEQQ